MTAVDRSLDTEDEDAVGLIVATAEFCMRLVSCAKIGADAIPAGSVAIYKIDQNLAHTIR